MAGSILVRYAKKSYRQLEKEEGEHAQMKKLNHSVELVPGSEVVRYCENHEEANRFAQSMHEHGHHVLEVRDEYA
jgi:hypothetical protein